VDAALGSRSARQGIGLAVVVVPLNAPRTMLRVVLGSIRTSILPRDDGALAGL
jgi:hypothetical protein